MNRRNFIRVAGGGVVFAATAGCGTQPPAGAVAAWQGPGDEPDLRRWVLAWALLAPNAHNLQSWVVGLDTPGEIVLRCDPARLLPQTDPFSRQILVSHGCFLELLDLAARERGHRAEITLFPEGEFAPEAVDARPVARIRLVPDATVTRDPLFSQIPHRHTNRSIYEPARPVPATAWQAMQQAAAPCAVNFGWVSADQPALLQRHRAIAAQAWRIELTTPRTLMESLQLLRVGAAEIERHRDGLALQDPATVLLVRLGLFDRSRAPATDDPAITSQISEFNDKLASTPGFLWLLTRGNDRRSQVAAGRAYARVQLAATAEGLAMQPLSQALQEYPEQAGPHADIHELLGAAPSTHTVQMWARIGFAAPVAPAPRRGLAWQLAGS